MELRAAIGTDDVTHRVGQIGRGHEAGRHCVFEVVAAVGDAVGPGDDLALGRRRRRPVPRVVADRVERLGAQVERREHDVGAVHGVVVAALEEGRERLFGCMAGGAVPAVVAGGGRRGEGDVEADRPGDADRHLGDLDRVGEAGAEVVVVGSDEDLALAGEPPEGLRVVDAVEVALEAGAQAIGLLGRRPVARAAGPGGSRRQHDLVVFLPASRGRATWPGSPTHAAAWATWMTPDSVVRACKTVLLPRCSEYRGGVTYNGDR